MKRSVWINRETVACPVGVSRGGWAAHLIREGFWRRQPGETERGPGTWRQERPAREVV